MITSLDKLIGVGLPWPPSDVDEAERISEHQRNRKLYEEKHVEIFQKYAAYLSDKIHDDKKAVIILGWAGTATDCYMDMVFNEPPKIEAPTIYDRPDEEVFIDVSRYGIGLYEVSQDGIGAINPENVYLVTDPGNIRKVTAYVVFSEFSEGKGEATKHYVKFTIYEPGSIGHEVWQVKEGKFLRQAELAEHPAFASLQVDSDGKQWPFGKDPNAPMLIVRVDNALSTERRYGRSDYTPSVHSLIEQLDTLFSRRAETLAKFGRPTPVVPDTAAPFNHALQKRQFKPEDAIITKQGDVPPTVLTWQADLANVERTIDQTMDQLLAKLKLSKVLLAGENEGTASSGTALRIRLIPTLSKVRKFASALKTALPQVLSLKSKLDVALQVPEAVAFEPDKVTIQIKDGIPDDPMEKAQIRAQNANAIAALCSMQVIDSKTGIRAAILMHVICKEALEPFEDAKLEALVNDAGNQAEIPKGM